jgi:hypothetical protein
LLADAGESRLLRSRPPTATPRINHTLGGARRRGYKLETGFFQEHCMDLVAASAYGEVRPALIGFREA